MDGGNGVQGIKGEVKGKVRINSDQEFVEQVRESALLCASLNIISVCHTTVVLILIGES